MADDAPGGLSVELFKSISVEVGEWLWGTVQGAFNEKATHSQIIVDAAIGMIPLVGDVTGVRDLIAVIIGLADDPRKREDKMQWVLLAVLALSLIPVLGGVLKGVGRLSLKAFGEAAKLTGQGARAAHLTQAAQDMVAFLNRVGWGNAERWLVKLKFAAHEAELVKRVRKLFETLISTLGKLFDRAGALMPTGWKVRTESLIKGLQRLSEEVSRRIPDALKELDQQLRELQAYVRAGGETTSQATAHALAAEGKTLTYTDELILLEGKGAKRSVRGGLEANSPLASEVSAVYERQDGFPNLSAFSITDRAGNVVQPNIATFAGKIVNRHLEPGEQFFRVFGPAGTTHGTKVGESLAAGSRSPSFWGVGSVPTQAERWRRGSAVLDEWNRDGFVVVGTVLRETRIPGCVGLIAEQKGVELGVQYLEGGAKQAMLDLPTDVAAELNRLGKQASASGSVQRIELWGVSWELRPSGWEDVNGIHGYLHMPGPGSVQTARLGARELASKREQE